MEDWIMGAMVGYSIGVWAGVWLGLVIARKQ